ncbi:MAG: electron transfer flavoprotein subunit beta/FixA family protein [Desulfitobacteriaceae bacterium]|nr:electron transfer flavoprotein subunit beta/FixA family protein [Desulfitobacteriaceae bacterium]MDD4400517.1 electron transfer flavoprotein subunit beta/FixA family protein [Desulfitobacteriaceae bacterium]
MDIIVCIKQVPGTTNVEVDPLTGVLIRDGVESKLNPYDLFALELAMQLNAADGGQTSVISMGPPQAGAVVREAIFMGAVGGKVVSDRRFAGADVLATSYTLSQGLRKMADFDLLICGKQTTDGDTGQVGAEIAEFLGLPHIGNVLAVEEIKNREIVVKVNLDSSIVRQKLPLPCLICTDGDINTPRLPSYRRKKEFNEASLVFISLEDFDDKDESHYGLSGSPTQVERIFPPEKNQEKQMFHGSGTELAANVYALLHEQKFVD